MAAFGWLATFFLIGWLVGGAMVLKAIENGDHLRGDDE